MLTALLALSGAGCGGTVPPQERAPYGGAEELPERLEGHTVVVGDPDAPLTVRIYEDPRCPYCKEYELTGAAPVLRGLTRKRQVQTEYVLASFLDDRLGGDGSKRAVNALRAALEVNKFVEYHAVLYENQPAEGVDGFTTEFLLELADRVDGLRSPAFDAAVESMKYRDFVTLSQLAYDQAGADGRGPGTPSATVNGMLVPPDSGVLLDGESFARLIRGIQLDPGSLAEHS
ncbi:thioredoxin domain-containing protein [Streptomyces sp. NPDC057445]|uniref:DsbA family protein n=1 Tax=Streptomyces sp. NPDC057445 TaxID=3346136 RepID=UPI003686C2C5